jgi:RHS repeat-associated protein
VEERLYLTGFELFRRRQGGVVVHARETLHVVDGEKRVALVETLVQGDGDAAPVVRYQLSNHLGTTCLELDEGGAVISYEEYHPYGSTAYQAGPSAAQVSLKRYRYTGRERDDETGLYHHETRYYAPWLGRWTAPDPAGLADGLNVYLYVRGSPVTLQDPSGMGPPDPEFDYQMGNMTDQEAKDYKKQKQEEKEAEWREQSRREAAAAKKGREIGKKWGEFAGDVENFLDVMKDTQNRLPKEEREKDVDRMLDKMEQLPVPEDTFSTEGEQRAYAAGMSGGFGGGKLAVVAAMVAETLIHDIIAGGGARGLRLPSLKWGRWAGTPGNSKFLLNAAGKAKFGVGKGEVAWLRFTKGKADFSAVARVIKDGEKSLRIPALKAPVAAGTSGGQLRSADHELVLKELAKTWGKTEAEVAQFLKDNGLRVHHYKDDLIQLVPKSYHRMAHEGTIKERLAKMLVVASALGMGDLLQEVFDQMEAYKSGTYGR